MAISYASPKPVMTTADIERWSAELRVIDTKMAELEQRAQLLRHAISASAAAEALKAGAQMTAEGVRPANGDEEEEPDPQNMTAALQTLIDHAPKGITTRQMRDWAMRQDEFKQRLASNPYYVSSVTHRLIKKGTIRKSGKKFFSKRAALEPSHANGSAHGESH